MIGLRALFAAKRGTAAAEMALITPLLLGLMFGSLELGNYFLDEHALVKQVRDGARFASRMPLQANYTCPTGSATGTVGAPAVTAIGNVTRTGTVGGTGTGRFNTAYWTRNCGNATQTLTVTVRCIPSAQYDGVWQSLPGDIPVVKVSSAIRYRSLLGTLGLANVNLCLTADSEIPVIGS